MLVAEDLSWPVQWRNIGPHRGGRVVAVAGHPSEPMTFYFGSTGGGVWKTTNGGNTWSNISDGFFKSASVGAIAVAPSDPNVLYVGMGEACIRGNVSFGDGVYRSDDGGRHWRHLGLEDTRHIGRVRVHPNHPDVVYVAALGHAFGPHPARGVYRSEDGGRRWEQVLAVSPHTGAVDLSLDPDNPRIMFAALWQVRRYPWKLESGGPESGLYRSRDGGATWRRLGEAEGLPGGIWGRSGVAVAYGRPGRVYALIEHAQGGLFRSDDWGDHWMRVNDDGAIRARPWYYSHLFADPAGPDGVYVLAGGFFHSQDGGAHFRALATPHPDHHDLWVDPRNPRRMIHGADGGAAVSFDGGETWSTLYNQPTGEFYHVAVDQGHPYRVYGSQQDNTTIAVPSRTDFLGITEREWFDVGGGESGHVAVAPDNPDRVFAGSSSFGEGGRITRFDRRTNLREDVSPWPALTRGLPASAYRYRFQWTTAMTLSPHDPRTVYVGANVVFRSRDEGQSWSVISPDLTRNDPETLGPTGGPITPDQSGAEVYGTVFALAESPMRRGLIWAGSDDGVVSVSRDDGGHWETVTPPDFPPWTTVLVVEPSRHDPDKAYMAATRYKLDDPTPYLFRTPDGGRSWTRITGGLPPDEYTRVIREDPVVPGLLYAGTERGVYVSWDDGDRWVPLQGNLPVTPVHDLVVHENDLVAATHGRGFWILDDVTPLRDMARRPPEGPVWLFTPGPVCRWVPPNGWYVFKAEDGTAGGPRWVAPRPGYQGADLDWTRYRGAVAEFPTGTSYFVTGADFPGDSPRLADAGQNPPRGAQIRYFAAPGTGMVHLRVFDADGTLVHEAVLGPGRGPGRHVWNLRGPVFRRPGGAAWPVFAPLVLPGVYRVELAAGGYSRTTDLEVRQDPRRKGSLDAYRATRDAVLELAHAVAAAWERADRWSAVRRGLDEWASLIGPSPRTARWAEFRNRLDNLMAELDGGGRGQPAGLSVQAAYTAELMEAADGRPGLAVLDRRDELLQAVQRWTAAVDALGAEGASLAAELGAEADRLWWGLGENKGV